MTVLSVITIPETITLLEIEPFESWIKMMILLRDKSNRLTTDMPCPSIHVFRWKTMFVPSLIARQSSWLMMVLATVRHDAQDLNPRKISPVLDSQIMCAAIKTIGIVTSRLPIALAVRQIALSCTQRQFGMMRAVKSPTIVNNEIWHHQRSRVGNAVNTFGRVHNANVLYYTWMSVKH